MIDLHYWPTPNGHKTTLACYPGIASHERQGQRLEDTPNLRRWFENVAPRPATRAAYARGEALRRPEGMSEEQRRILFGQTAASVRAAS